MGIGIQRMFVLGFLLAAAVVQVDGSHFRGGTINWKWLNSSEVLFQFRLGWAYGRGPGCTEKLLNQYVTHLGYENWVCQSNNCGETNLHDGNYYCTGASKAEGWEQGKADFKYTFPNEGPFTVGFADGNWIQLSNDKGRGKWNVTTTIDLRTRNDTGTPNSSPESQSKPTYYVKFDCENRIKIPVVDPNYDTVRCRWARGSECVSVCNALPFAQLDEETCTLIFNTTKANSYEIGGIYAVAVTIEDFPKETITLDGKEVKTPRDPLSTVPLQFLVKTIAHNSVCVAGPRFVPPTPQEGQVVIIKEGETFSVDLFADNQNDTTAKASIITATGPIHLKQTPVIPSVNLPNTYTTTLTWKTTSADIGSQIVCAHVTNTRGKDGGQRCFVVKVIKVFHDPGPRFIPPTPQIKDVLAVDEGKTIYVDLFTDNQNYTLAKANIITVSGPANINQSPVIPSAVSPDAYKTTLSWQTASADVGDHTICAHVSNDKGLKGIQRCFVIRVNAVSHDPGPRFVSPTPKEGQVLTVEEEKNISVGLYADNQNYTLAKANNISVSGPEDANQTPVTPSVDRPNTFSTKITWKPTSADVGNHTVCAHVINDKGTSGEERCFVIKVLNKPKAKCEAPPSPCKNGGKWIAHTTSYVCACKPGFTGIHCEVHINDCAALVKSFAGVR